MPAGGAEDRVTVAGRYRLDQLLARGGMAEVWKAHDLRLDRSVAVKVPLRHLRDRPEFLERFRREAVAAARLNHPRVVGVYDTGSDPDLGGYIVMELVDGPSLRTVLARDGSLPVDQAVGLAAEVASALDFAHQRGIVHRDIKPANVLLAADGAKVADFGIAKASQRGDDLTETSQTLGTARYLSPEQVESKPVDARSDVYSLGVLLYEMLCGRTPFDADSELALALKHVTTVPEAPAAVNPAVPPWLDEVVLEALAKSPDDRFISAAEMRRCLLAGGRAVRPPPGPSVPVAAPAPVTKVAPSRPLAPVPAGAHQVAAPGDPTSALLLAERPLPSAAPAGPGTDDPTRTALSSGPRPPPAPFRRWPVVSLVVAVVLVAAGLALAHEELGSNSAKTPTPPLVHGRLTAIRVAAAQSFNPPPGSGAEHQELVGNLIDGNPATSWTTEHYANRNFGNLKSGVGAYLRLPTPEIVARMVISSPETGWTFQVYEASGRTAPTTLAGWGTSVAHGAVDGSSTTVSVDDRKASFVLLWITRLPVGNFLRIGELTLYT